MPRDPLLAIKEQKEAFNTQEARLRTEAAKRITQKFPGFVQNASAEDLDAAVNVGAQELRAGLDSEVRDPSNLGRIESGIPGGIARNLLSKTLDVVPGATQSTFKTLGAGALEDLAGGDLPRLDDAGQLAGLVATTGAAAVPLLREGTLGVRLLQSAGAAGTAAAVSGGVNQVLENAQSLIDGGETDSKRTAIERAFSETPRDEIIARALGEAALETVVSGGAAFGPLAAKAGFAKLAGLSDEAASRMIALASRHEINLAVQDVTSLRALERARDTLGRIPIFNRPFRKRARLQAAEMREAVNDSLFSLAPSIRDIVEATGEKRAERILAQNVGAVNRIEGAMNSWRDEADRLYKSFRKAANENGAQVGNANTMFRAIVARKRIRNLPREQVTDRTGRQTLARPTPTDISGRIDKELTRLIDMEPLPDLEAFIRRGAEIEQLIQDLPPGSKEARGILIDMKRAMEDDMHTNLNAPEEVLQLLDEADVYFKEGIELFSGQAAKRFRRVDRSFGDVRLQPIDADSTIPNPGTASPSKVISTMLQTDDAGVIKNLHQIMLRGDSEAGQRAYNEMVGTHFERIVEGARDAEIRGADFEVTNTKNLRSALGLNNRSSDKYIANREMFKRAGVNLDEFGEVLDLADQFFKDGVPDISSFVSRRAVIGGLGSALRSFNPLQVTSKSRGGTASAADTVNNVVSAGAAFLLLKGGANHITKPNILKQYRVMLDPKRNAGVRIQAFKRLMLLDASFLVLDEATENAISRTQNTLSLGAVEAAKAAERFNRGRQQSGIIEGLNRTINPRQ